MDFELVSIMAAMIGERKEGAFYVISNDKGFGSAIRCLTKEYSDKPITIHQASSIANATGNRTEVITKHLDSVRREKEFDAKLLALLENISKEINISVIKDALAKTKCKDELYKSLISQLGNVNGLSVYKALKGNFHSLKDIFAA